MPITGSQKAQLNAQSGVIRSATSRSNVHSTKVFVAISGVQYATARADPTKKVLDTSLTINEAPGTTPNTADFTVQGFQPTSGQDVVITLGSINNLDRLFAGVLLTDGHGYIGSPSNGRDQVHAIDYTWHLTRRTISKRYTNQSATAIAKDIVTYVPGFTSLNVVLGLPTIDEITFTNVTPIDALQQLAKRIGGYAKVDYLKDVHLAVTDVSGTNPTALDSSTTINSMSDFTVDRDRSQQLTRVLFEGGGVTALAPVSVGETILPVESVAWYNPTGGRVASGPQRIMYGGTRDGGGGSLVGTGASPTGAPGLAVVAGAAGVETGDHDYAYTFVTGSGESLPSPAETVTVGGTMPTPTNAPTYVGHNIGVVAPDGYSAWSYTFVAGGGETTAAPSLILFLTGGSYEPQLGISLGPDGTTARNIYRCDAQLTYAAAQTAQLKYIGTIADNTTSTFLAPDVAGGSNVPVVNTTVNNHVNVSGIAIGGAAVTSRKVYRSRVIPPIVGASRQLRLLATIADNVTTTYADATADASLGAFVPTSDASGLTQPAGQVLAGSTTLILAGTGAFSDAGGWAVIGNGQVIRYTGITGSTLSGIPTTGLGAITASIAYNSTATAAPCLTGIPASGVGAILYAIRQGDPVNLLVEVNDMAAQAVLTLLFGFIDDGVIEAYMQDGRLSEIEALARANALLTLRSPLEQSVSYTTRDKNTRAGRTIAVNLAAPTSVVGSFKIQQVTITQFNPALWPTFTVHASNVRYTLEDLLRSARAGG